MATILEAGMREERCVSVLPPNPPVAGNIAILESVIVCETVM